MDEYSYTGIITGLKAFRDLKLRKVVYLMKIDVTGGYSVYRKKLDTEKPARESAAAGESKNASDVAEFSRGSTAIADKSLVALKSSIQRDIGQPASAERIDQLRTDVKNGTYRVPTEALVDSILGE